MPTRLLMPLLVLLLAAAPPPLPPQLLNDPTTTEGWIWQRVQAGEVSDLNDRCGTPPLDIHKRDDDRWRASCRRINPTLLRALLTQPDLADHTPHGVRIIGARIDGDLDLEDAVVRTAEVVLEGSRINAVDLNDARLDGALSLQGTLIDGRLTGERAFIGMVNMDAAVFGGSVDLELLHVGAGGLSLNTAKFGGPLDLRGAYVEGQLTMVGVSIAEQQTFDAEFLHVGATGFILNNSKFGGPVHIPDANVEGQIDMDGVSVADHQAFVAERLHVGAAGLLLSNVKFGGPVDLRNARVEGQLLMEGASIAVGQTFDADFLHAEGGLFPRDVQFGGPVNLRGAWVAGEMDMAGASIAAGQMFDAHALHTGVLFLRHVKFGGSVILSDVHVDDVMAMDFAAVAGQQPFDAERLHVGGSFFARTATFGGAVNLVALNVNGDLDLRDSHVRQLNLADAAVRGDLRFGGEELQLHWDACDGPAPCLNLRNARVGNLQDDERAWPDQITLEGFTYTHLGGYGGEERQDMRNRPIDWWHRWLNKDPVYSAQPYAQLAGVLAASGNREGAADIRFFGRDRERSELLRGCTWLQKLGLAERPEGDRPCRWGAGLGLSALQLFVGYGIGMYAFRAAYWALALALIGTIILCFAPGVLGVRPTPLATTRGPRQKSLLWCFGASLHHVLPLVTISQEFSEFFNDPKRERLYPWQHAAFGVLALCGWALGLFVVAAFSGLIQS